MDFKNLTYFMEVARALNFTRAAENLCMSQPPLSLSIQNLEEDLGVQLFIRGKRGLQLTEAGNLLLRRSAQILDIADKARTELSQLQGSLSGTLFIGMVEGRAPFLVAEWLKGFREEFPLVKYELWNGSSDDVLDQLYKGLAEVAVVASPFDGEKVESIMVGTEPWVALMSEQNPLASVWGDEIPLSALVGQPLIVPRRKSRVEAIVKWFAEIGAEPQIICEQSNYVDALALALSNAGICIFPHTTPESLGGVSAKVIIEPSKIAEYALVWNRGRPLSKLGQAFVDYVGDVISCEESEVEGTIL